MRPLLRGATPVYKTPLAAEAYQMDGANSHSSRSWKRFAAMRTGEVAPSRSEGFIWSGDQAGMAPFQGNDSPLAEAVAALIEGRSCRRSIDAITSQQEA